MAGTCALATGTHSLDIGLAQGRPKFHHDTPTAPVIWHHRKINGMDILRTQGKYSNEKIIHKSRTNDVITESPHGGLNSADRPTMNWFHGRIATQISVCHTFVEEEDKRQLFRQCVNKSFVNGA